MAKNIFVVGGVVSSLGKGIAASSIGLLLKKMGYKVGMLKFDPYLNVDPGTMSPFQHGEVFVTDDGAEADLDLGHYERFVDESMSKLSNYTAGKIYERVLKKERQGDYLGKTVQVIPHVTNEIKLLIRKLDEHYDIVITEIGGTVGDIESLPFLEAIRQYRLEAGMENSLYVFLTYVPFIASAGELKTKPTQHSAYKLREIGIQPDILICRSDQPFGEEIANKIALFTNVPQSSVFNAVNVDCIYEVPLNFEKQGIHKTICKHLRLPQGNVDLSNWKILVDNVKNPRQEVKIAVCGKYVEHQDAYKSVCQALIQAAAYHRVKLKLLFIDSEKDLSSHPDILPQRPEEEHRDDGRGCRDGAGETKRFHRTGNSQPSTPRNQNSRKKIPSDIDGILIPGGFGVRGINGKIEIVQVAREKKIPYLGICLGMQVAVIEFARNVCGLTNAYSSEFSSGKDVSFCPDTLPRDYVEKRDPTKGNYHSHAQSTKSINPVIDIMNDQKHIRTVGGTMRLGAFPCKIREGTKTAEIYNAAEISERHRHRYEFNNHYRKLLEDNGMIIAGTSPDERLVEIVELAGHPFFIGVQFHPEFKSRPELPHPLFKAFIKAAINKIR